MQYANEKHNQKSILYYTIFLSNSADDYHVHRQQYLHLANSAECLVTNRSWSNIWNTIHKSWVGFRPWLNADACQKEHRINSTALLAAYSENMQHF